MADQIIPPKPLFDIASEFEDTCVDLRCCTALLNAAIERADLADRNKMAHVVDNAIYLLRDLDRIRKDFERVNRLVYGASEAERASV